MSGMSWIVYLMGAAGFDSVRDFPEGWSPPVLGPRDSVIRRLREALPSVSFPTPAEGILHGDGFSITFELGPWEQTPRVKLFVHGEGEEVLDLIGRVAEALDARALDTGLGDFMRFRKDPDTGRHIWRDAPTPGQWVAPA
ncbi:hypothetical protein JRI60_00085 [Archangium violaceum]|jgi:hypothetical protein|uniref:hypothetical protein n=1 Tax=Archangium violaceum TaxID=83451 RepID=UPI001951AA30|nr:hypothetical protein [Archangium violaceum]QRN97530.1 hypothetical protein JRI60_00085 [Archangium violaceum]